MGHHLSKEERREQLMQAALVAFGRRGYHTTQVSDIIRQAKVARGTFYLYFDGKREIFAALLFQISEKIEFQVRNIPIDAFSQIPHQLLGNIQRVTRLLIENPLFIKLVFSDAVGLDATFDKQLRQFYERILDYIRRGLRQGQAMGFVRKTDVNILAIALLGCIKEAFYQYILGTTKKPSIGKIEQEIYTFVLNGIVHPQLRSQVEAFLTESKD